VGVLDPAPHAKGPVGGMSGLPQYIEALRAGVRDELREAAAEAGDGAETEFREGPPAHELADATRELDLLVMGSRGYGPVRAVLLGATARIVVGEASCPVVVVPRAHEPVPIDVSGTFPVA
jgi:nucleotide-binding universal stress UspA family protein